MRWLLSLLLTCPLVAAPVPVKVIPTEGGWRLERGGTEYFIKGAGGPGSLELLATSGGNSIRTWGAEKLGATLEQAGKLELTVAAGIWLGQVRQGFKWTDPASIERQRKHVRATVERHKNHPALLVWALGNEMEDSAGTNEAVWREINHLARMVKEIDPHHPVMTVVAEIGGARIANFHALCPDVDILGINAYAGAPSVGERYARGGGTKPFVLAEFGPPGIWELGKNASGAYDELTSTEKAESYRKIYKAVVVKPACLGSYVFLWGQKQEATATWFSMFLQDGTRLGAVDTMAELWTGKPPQNKVPEIRALVLVGSAKVRGGSTVAARLDATDPEGGELAVTWVLQHDNEKYGTGGDVEMTPRTHPEAIIRGDRHEAEITLPSKPGLYRLFSIVKDPEGGAAVANQPIRVQ